MSSGDDQLARAARDLYQGLQDSICAGLERLDGTGRFREDTWQREGGGGGRSRVMTEGRVFEKAGVGFSEVFGPVEGELERVLAGDGPTFYATGVSLVLHPRSPRVPTVHANFRYLGRGSARWFGGGSDLTPYYLDEADARHFHGVWRAACDQHDPTYYPRFKRWCDEYFYLPHRGEARGVGGIFYDDLGKGEAPEAQARHLAFARSCGEAFLPAYVPIVERHQSETWTEAERAWQLLRRGRYVEFNLIHDRGTLFGLRTKGRTESILMSLPPLVRWEYDAAVPGPAEAALLEVLRTPRDWL